MTLTDLGEPGARRPVLGPGQLDGGGSADDRREPARHILAREARRRDRLSPACETAPRDSDVASDRIGEPDVHGIKCGANSRLRRWRGAARGVRSEATDAGRYWIAREPE